MSLVLGVDPGLTRCGYGLISGTKAIDYGMFQSSKTDEPTTRVGQIAQELERLISRKRPDLIALERVFAQANLRSVMGVAQISGALMAIAHREGIPVEFFTPSEVKASVAGHGRATKDQVAFMVRKILGLADTPKPADVADALAVAICAQNKSQIASTDARKKWVSAAKAANRKLG
jgi:crossover junction endodeoxyribonuclease RuvC